MKAHMSLSRTELFILDHALGIYIQRDGASEDDLRTENDLLDRVNGCIKGMNFYEKRALMKVWRMNKNTIIPSTSEDNPWMYCNYAREHRCESPCKNCTNKCKHRGKETTK